MLPQSPAYPTVRNRPSVAGAWQYREQLSMLLVPMTARPNFCITYPSSLLVFDEIITPIASGPLSCLIFRSFPLIKVNASSHVVSRNVLPSRMRGRCSRSRLLTNSHPNFPFTHVEISFVGPCIGTIFRICRSFVHTS